jgi:hypothetical protein
LDEESSGDFWKEIFQSGAGAENVRNVSSQSQAVSRGIDWETSHVQA